MGSPDAKMLYRDRIEVAIEIWDKILKGEVTDRNHLRNLLKDRYRRTRIKPLMGFYKSGIYDKEIATVFVVGKYGLGIVGDETTKTLSNLFSVEIKCNKTYQLLKNKNYQPDTESIKQINEIINEDWGPKLKTTKDKALRILRYVFTGVILRFIPEEDLVNTYKALGSIYTNLTTTLKGYIKFYVAFKVAEDIALHRIRKPEEEKIMKYVYCLRLGLTKCIPTDAQIRAIATHVLKTPQNLVNTVIPPITGNTQNQQ
ncbi:DUF2192 domain-containing protein [Vulcanisaeta thermophila]|uniref:DUF2192 domain-containing protein n=1 Tax=Vulcanisaeta thermophila TaxID=867917 RepID=UPI001EE31CD1|nr:DUF2192 domain-containing protein [Vulcanisaeta thermophila]